MSAIAGQSAGPNWLKLVRESRNIPGVTKAIYFNSTGNVGQFS